MIDKNNISRKVKMNIAMSNMKEELEMKKVSTKKGLIISLLTVIVLSGSFVTVNAATNGSLTNAVAQTISGWTRTETKTDEGNFVTYTKDGTNAFYKGYDPVEDSNFYDKLNGISPSDTIGQ